MFEYLKRLFAKPTPLELATEELVQAERAKLEAETGREYADALVSYNNARITRLRKYIANLTKEEVK
jgi:hypothetical protein